METEYDSTLRVIILVILIFIIIILFLDLGSYRDKYITYDGKLKESCFYIYTRNKYIYTGELTPISGECYREDFCFFKRALELTNIADVYCEMSRIPLYP